MPLLWVLSSLPQVFLVVVSFLIGFLVAENGGRTTFEQKPEKLQHDDDDNATTSAGTGGITHSAGSTNNTVTEDTSGQENDDNDSAINLLQQMIAMHNAPLKEAPESMGSRQRRILETKDDIHAILELRKAMDKRLHQVVTEVLQKKEQEMAALFDSFSPLLSVGDACLAKILDYLDESALLCAERASYKLGRIAAEHGHWQQLHATSPQRYVFRNERNGGFPWRRTGMYWRRPKRTYPRQYTGITETLSFDNDDTKNNNDSKKEREAEDIASALRYLGDYMTRAKREEWLAESYYNYAAAAAKDHDSDSANERQGKELAFASMLRGGKPSPLNLYSKVAQHFSQCFVVRISVAQPQGRKRDLGNRPKAELAMVGQGVCPAKRRSVHYRLFSAKIFTVDLTPLREANGDENDNNNIENQPLQAWPELQDFLRWVRNVTEPELQSPLASELAKRAFERVRVTLMVNGKTLVSTGGFQSLECKSNHRQKVYLQNRFDFLQMPYNDRRFGVVEVQTAMVFGRRSMTLDVRPVPRFVGRQHHRVHNWELAEEETTSEEEEDEEEEEVVRERDAEA